MEKTKKRNMKYNGISANEHYLLQLVREKGLLLFGVQELYRLSGWSKSRIHNTFHTLKEKGHIIWIKRSRYTTPEILVESSYAVATEAVKPSYISYWTALAYYGFTEQQPQVIQLVTSKQQAKPKLLVEVTTLKSRRFYGYQRVNNYVMAEKEKALVDSLYQSEKCGGLEEVIKCLKNAWGEINQKIFYSYLIRFNSKSLNSRAGYLIETLRLGKPPKKLLKNRSKSYIRLNRENVKTSNYNHKWKIIINHELTEVTK